MSLKQMAADIGAQLGNCNTTHCACGRYLDSDPGAVPDSPFPQTPCSFEEGDGLSFRLVDVNSGCIKHASLDDRYIALSYICCKEDIFRVDENMLASLSVEGALAGTSLRLSKTISDAIDFTREMGERYLWVDALCLAYDNQDDVDRGLWISNSIWSNAYLTLVAASGDHADAGLLPELSELPDCPTTMTGFDALEEELSRSAFSTRGWTLHELAFSRRLAIFLNGQVHYYCRESEQRCNSDLLPNRARVDHLRTFSLRFGIPNSLDGAIPSMIAYRSLCEAYSLRKLRREGDSIRALASANRSLLAGMKSIGVEGLPGYYIGYFQLFYSPHGNLRRRPEFASFSWAGWEGEIRWPRHEVDETDPSNLLRWIRDKPLVDWNALRPDAHLHYLSDISLEEGPSLLEVFVRRLPQIFSQQAVQGFVEDRTAAAAYGLYNSSSGWESCPDSWDEHIKAWRGGERPVLPLDFFPSEALDTVNSSRELGEMLRRIDGTKFGKAKQSWYAQQRYKQKRSQEHGGRAGRIFRRDTVFRKPRAPQGSVADEKRLGKDRRAIKGQKTAVEQGQRDPALPLFPPYTVLRAYAITLRLVLGEPRAASSEQLLGQGRPLLSESGQRVVGSLYPDDVSRLPSESDTLIDCIVLAQANRRMDGSALLRARHSELERPSLEEDLVWIMHVEWTDGIAERRGIGQIYVSGLEAAVAPGPKLQIVMLG